MTVRDECAGKNKELRGRHHHGEAVDFVFDGGRKLCGAKGQKVKKVMSFKHLLDSFDDMQALISRTAYFVVLRVVEEQMPAAMRQQVEP